MQPIIRLEHVTAAYEDKIVLQDATLTVFDHDFLGIIGPNGGGKTTLIRIILGLMKPISGQVTYLREGRPVHEITMGYLPQYNDIDRRFPISVYEVVLSGLSRQKRFLRPYTREQHQQVRETIHRMELEEFERKPIGALSGGQLQRVLLARAIVSHPEVVVLDEPNTYIDKRFQEQMYQILDTINRDCAIIIVSHDIGTILQNVKDVACVNRTLHYHASTEISEEELQEHFGCPIELLGHGDMPHRVLKKHED
ncbi:metal ABC transporter ATP-binding protein [Hoylesella enoeca]|uniref:Zinc ABC transporter ATP-binding protein n=1 Tax=Hoylesella enoeca TaxID=76123 RepID=A0A0S2KJA4_9BACT|nr:metal ABC transporter ATP-binding protein [Hoylesella enoeca]ALO48158.1 zinc ABC transporter ATP-binding protein [Hoylesella enoeca]